MGASGNCACTYFRTSIKLLNCATADAEKVRAGDPYPPPSNDPELDGPAMQSFVKVDCECEYSLTGSNVLCDVDQTVEKTAIIGADQPAETCRQGRALCKDSCPSRLP